MCHLGGGQVRQYITTIRSRSYLIRPYVTPVSCIVSEQRCEVASLEQWKIDRILIEILLQ